MKKIDGKLVSIGTILLIVGLVIGNYFGNPVTAAEEKNLVKNGDMEAGDPPDDWGAAQAKLSADTEDAYSGKQSLKIVAFKDLGRASQTFKCEPGKRYRFEFMYKCRPLSKIYFYVNPYEANAVLLADLKADNTWTAYETEFTIPADLKSAYSAQVGFCTYIDQEILIDDVIITEVVASAEK